jgi:hypothetical protein
MVYEWIERFKNGRTSIKHEEGARRRASGSFLMLSADHCPLLFFAANEKWTVQVYDTKLMNISHHAQPAV